MMRIFGLEIGRAKALHSVPQYHQGWKRILEPFAGAFQRNIEERQCDVLCYPALYACLNRISQDIGKLPFLLKRIDSNGIWQTTENPAYSPVLRKPNHYQTAQQFREAWALSKLISGNAYILKRRDERGVVTGLYVLDPCRVMVMVSDSGDVFYQLNYPYAANLLPENYPAEQLTIPAREIIHDRLNCFHHQLIGVPPVCAAYWPAVKNLKILKNSAEFFANHAQPGGILSAPAGMSEPDAQAIREFWDSNYGGENRGKIAVLGADMKFTSFAVNSADSQLVEQMRYSDEQICQPFGVPPFKIGIGSIPAGLGVDAINLLYYNDALQGHIESMENLLDEALKIPADLGIWMDLEPLLRMDAGKQAEILGGLVKNSIATPNEARNRVGYGPLDGGGTVYMQQQNYSLAALAKRDAQADPFGTAQPAAPEPEDDTATEEVRRLSAELWQRKALEATREAINA